jgi:dTDP-4-dehydrorhamnose 3,5-epimerase
MKMLDTGLPGLVLIELKIHRDDRGFFVERFQEASFKDHNLPTHFVQDNHSRSMPGVLRGLHWQIKPAQAKLVHVIRGRIWDVAVDIRPDSATFGQFFGTELSDENGRALFIPGGFAHGFCVLGNEFADVVYKVDGAYNPAGERGLHWADPYVGIPWPVKSPMVSERDRRLPSWADFFQKQKCA